MYNITNKYYAGFMMYNIINGYIKAYKIILKKVFLVLCFVFLCACEEVVLYKNIEENEANLMTATLMKENVPVERIGNKDGTYNIIITDNSEFSRAISILSMRGLPKAKFESLCTIFKGDGMVSTPVEQKARYTCAKSQELSGSLNELDGVSAARVHLVLAETDPISRKVKPASASIMIKYKAGMDVDALVPRIKQLVSYGVEELPYQNVSVMLSEELGHKEEALITDSDNKAYAQNALNESSHKTNENVNLFETPADNNNSIINTDTASDAPSNMLFLYVLMGVMAVGMTIVIYVMMQIQNKKLQKTTGVKPYDENPHNLPIEF
jgi:type III secretion system YscJ/HrcJ family lipoprotein